MQSLAPPDAPLRWGRIVAAAAFLTLAVVCGVWCSCSVFLVTLLAEFGWSHLAGGAVTAVGLPVRAETG